MRLADLNPQRLRTAYVTLMRVARGVARRLGFLALLERSRWPALRFVRSLFAIYDVEDLAALDLPWWNFATIKQVEAFLARRPDARVFEYGSGASTVWLARRAAVVRAVEHDPEFADAVRGLLDGFHNAEVLTVPARPLQPGRAAVTSERAKDLDFSDYVAAIERLGETFDLIVIDGRARVESFQRAAPYLAEDGLLVFDDVERARYQPALDTPEFHVKVLRGLTPCVPYRTSTALLTRRRP